MITAEAATGPTTELLQALIRNECVNDGTPDSGDEVRNADLLQTYLEGAGLDVARFDSRPGRTSIVARIEGQRSRRPDAVPDGPHRRRARQPRRVVARPVRRRADRRRGVGPRRHRHAQHHVVDGRRLPPAGDEGFRPKGTLIYFGVADEEAGGHWGAEYMVDQHWDAVGADYVLTESGGWSTIGHDGTRHVTVNVAEKGSPGAACGSTARRATARCPTAPTTR